MISEGKAVAKDGASIGITVGVAIGAFSGVTSCALVKGFIVCWVEIKTVVKLTDLRDRGRAW